MTAMQSTLDAYSAELLAVFPHLEKEAEVNPNAGTALTIAQQVALSNRLIANAIDKIALVLMRGWKPQSKDLVARELEIKNKLIATRQIVSQRLVKNQQSNRPLEITVFFEGRLVRDRHNPEQVIDIAVWTKILNDEVAHPLLIIDMPFVTLCPDGSGNLQSNGAFQCLVLKPKKEKGAWKVFPIGLCDKGELEAFNTWAASTGNPGRAIAHIPNDIGKPGTKVFEFTPTQCEPNKYWKGAFDIGAYKGKNVILDPSSQPIAKEASGEHCKQNFAGREEENRIVARWMALAGNLEVRGQTESLELDIEMNPFECLGTKIESLDTSRVDELVVELMEKPLNDGHPVVAYAIALGLIGKSTPRSERSAHVQNLAQIAAAKAKRIIEQTFEQMWGRLGDTLPKLAEILGEDTTVEEALAVRSGEDAVTRFITERLGSFDYKVPMHRQLRKEVIRRAERQAIVDGVPSVVPSKAKAAKKEEPDAGNDVEPKIFTVGFRGQVNRVKPVFDCLELLGLVGKNADDLRGQPIPDPDLTTAGKVLNDALVAAGGKEADAATLATVIEKAKKAVTAAAK